MGPMEKSILHLSLNAASLRKPQLASQRPRPTQNTTAPHTTTNPKISSARCASYQDRQHNTRVLNQREADRVEVPSADLNPSPNLANNKRASGRVCHNCLSPRSTLLSVGLARSSQSERHLEPAGWMSAPVGRIAAMQTIGKHEMALVLAFNLAAAATAAAANSK